MLHFCLASGLLLAALGGWARTHIDLLGCPWFRRHRLAQRLAGLVPPAAGAILWALVGPALAAERPWALALCATLAGAGLALWTTRPCRPRGLVRVEPERAYRP